MYVHDQKKKRRTPAAPISNMPASSNIIQRKIGFEFQTNLLIRDIRNHSPQLRTFLYQGDGWHIECDQGELEFITEPYDNRETMHSGIQSIVNFAGTIAAYPNLFPSMDSPLARELKEQMERDKVSLSNAQQRGCQKEITLFEESIASCEIRALPFIESAKTYFAVGTSAITAKPQATVGIPLEYISYVFENAEEKKHATPDKENPLTLRQIVLKTRDILSLLKNDISGEQWEQLTGLVILTAHYANAGIHQKSISYIKSYISMMSRTNFAALYQELDKTVRDYYTPELISRIIDMPSNIPLFQYAVGKTKKKRGPSLEDWVNNIKFGRDLLTQEHSSGLLTGSESMGAFSELDTNSDGTQKLVPIEFRGIPGGLPYQQWQIFAENLFNDYDPFL